MSLFKRNETSVQASKNLQTVRLQQLLSSAVVATADAGYAASRKFYDNLCDYAFVKSTDGCDSYSGLRTLDFEYCGNDGEVKTISVPILSLLPLTMLQVQDADFTFDVQIADLEYDEESDISEQSEQLVTEVGGYDNLPSMRVTLLPTTVKSSENGGSETRTTPSLNVHISLGQSDVPGGMARLLQTINNLDFKKVKPNAEPDGGDKPSDNPST